MSEQNITGCVEKEAEKPPTSPGLTGCKPAADSKLYQQSAQLKSPRELKQMLLSFSTHSCVGATGKKSPNFNISFLIVFIYKGLVHTSVKSFMIFGLLVLTISDL